MTDNRNVRIWRAVTFSGCGLIALGLGTLCLGAVFTEINVNLCFPVLGIGLLFLFIGLIGWSTRLEKQQRRKIGAFLLFTPLAICACVGFADPNVHGILPLFFIASVPVCLFGIIVLLMSLKG